MLTLKLENLVELNNLQEKITEEILDIVLSNEVVWEHHAINTNNSSCDGETEYFSTPYRDGYIIISGCGLYYALEEYDYTWSALVDYNSIHLGNYTSCAETYNKLVDMHYRMRILSA